MANLKNAFNPAQHNPTQGDGSLPAGRWGVMATSSAIQGSNNNANSGYIKYVVQILTGDRKGSTGPIRFNIYNESEKAREIGERQLSAMLHCIGHTGPLQATEQAHGKPFIIEVTPARNPEDAAKGYTEVTKFLLGDGTEPSFTNHGPRNIDESVLGSGAAVSQTANTNTTTNSNAGNNGGNDNGSDWGGSNNTNQGNQNGNQNNGGGNGNGNGNNNGNNNGQNNGGNFGGNNNGGNGNGNGNSNQGGNGGNGGNGGGSDWSPNQGNQNNGGGNAGGNGGGKPDWA